MEQLNSQEDSSLLVSGLKCLWTQNEPLLLFVNGLRRGASADFKRRAETYH